MADDAGWRARARLAEEHLAALDAALQGIARVRPVAEVLQLIVDRARELAGARYAALGISDEAGVIEEFHTSGISAAARRRIGALPHGRGLLGVLIHERRSLRLPRIADDRRSSGFPAHHPPMTSFLGVPILSRGRAIGSLYLTDKEGSREFTAADQRLLERFALHAGVAMDNARLNQQVQALAVVEERERISRDLHDGVIQRIYAVALGLDDVPDQVASDPAAAAARVDEAIGALNATIGEVRSIIYSLRPRSSGTEGVASALRALADETHRLTGAEVDVDVSGADVGQIDERVADNLLQIVREGLSNVARHASARHVQVAVAGSRTRLRLSISDDGRGFDTAASRPESHHGLRNVTRRVERLGGTLSIRSRPGRGTRLAISIPLGSARRTRRSRQEPAHA